MNLPDLMEQQRRELFAMALNAMQQQYGMMINAVTEMEDFGSGRALLRTTLQIVPIPGWQPPARPEPNGAKKAVDTSGQAE